MRKVFFGQLRAAEMEVEICLFPSLLPLIYCVMRVKHCLNCKVQQHISAASLLSAVSI